MRGRVKPFFTYHIKGPKKGSSEGLGPWKYLDYWFVDGHIEFFLRDNSKPKLEHFLNQVFQWKPQQVSRSDYKTYGQVVAGEGFEMNPRWAESPIETTEHLFWRIENKKKPEDPK